MHDTYTRKHQEALKRKGVELCRRGPLLSHSRCPDDLSREENPAVSRQALNKGIGRRKGREGGKRREQEEETMEEEEVEVLCYLDRVLEEEEEVFEYGDGELDPITLTHRQFKVRQGLDAGKTHLYTQT